MATIAETLSEGLAHHRAGRLADAAARYRQIVAADPGHAEALHLLGAVALQEGRHDAAIDLISRAIGRDSGRAHYHVNLGRALMQAQDTDGAITALRRALALQPDLAEAYNHLGDAFADRGDDTTAVAHYRQALALQPDYTEAHNNLAVALHRMRDLAGAKDHYEHTLALRPDLAQPLSNLANLAREQGHLDAAIGYCRQALDRDPTLADGHWNMSLALLTGGDFVTGWREFEYRWECGSLRGLRRNFRQPQWRGEAIGDRVLLLHAEQGLGDTLQFCRYVSAAAAKARVILEVQRPLVRLLSTLGGGARIVAKGDPLPPFDLQCPLMSLPLAFGTTLGTIPNQVPYLTADPAAVAAWRRRLAHLGGVTVGLVWSGNPRAGQPDSHAIDRRRSVTLAHLAPLGAIPGVALVSLQKGAAAAETRTPPPGMIIHDWTDALDDFADTAALVMALDLVITVDTSVVHLAGALGKETWLLNRYDTCWRWLTARDDSPWYPSLQYLPPAGAGRLGERHRRDRRVITPTRHRRAGLTSGGGIRVSVMVTTAGPRAHRPPCES